MKSTCSKPSGGFPCVLPLVVDARVVVEAAIEPRINDLPIVPENPRATNITKGSHASSLSLLFSKSAERFIQRLIARERRRRAIDVDERFSAHGAALHLGGALWIASGDDDEADHGEKPREQGGAQGASRGAVQQRGAAGGLLEDAEDDATEDPGVVPACGRRAGHTRPGFAPLMRVACVFSRVTS